MIEKFMAAAIQKAYKGVQKGQTPFGAVIVRNGRIVAAAHNTVWKTTDITAHAEITAIRLACRKLKRIHLKGCEIYSTCEPCPMCFSAIHWAQIKKIYYGTNIADAKMLGFNELCISNTSMRRIGKSRVRMQKNVLRKENLELFRFFLETSKTKTY